MIEEFDKIYKEIIGTTPLNKGLTYDGSQCKEEFIEAWNNIINHNNNNNLKKVKWLEIGAFKGLWGLMLSFVCEQLDIDYEYVTITWLDQDPEKNKYLFEVQKYYQNKEKNFHIIDGMSQDLKNRDKVLEVSKKYNMVFIDGDHSYQGVLDDIKLYYELSTDIVMFHDIRPKQITPNSHIQVYPAIEDSGIKLDKEIMYDVDGVRGIGLKFI